MDRLGALAARRPRLLAGTVLIAAGLAAVAAASGLRIRPGYVELLAKDSPENARYVALLEELGNVEALYLVVDAPEPEAAGAFVDRLVEELEELEAADGGPLVRSVLGRVELSWFRERLGAFLPAGALAEDAPLAGLPLEALAREPSAEALLEAVATTLEEALADGREWPGADRAVATIEALLREISRAAEGAAPASLGRVLTQSLGEDAGRGLDDEGRLRLPDGRWLVTVTPADARNDHQWLKRFLEAVDGAEARARAPGDRVRVARAGAPVLVVDEMGAAQRDVTRSTILALALVTALFLASFHSVRHVGAAVAALLAGLGLTFGAALLLVGYLNLFSVVFAAVLVGLGIDFGIHVVNGYESARRAGRTVEAAVRSSLRVVGPATLLGAVTTAAAFFTTTTSDFLGFSQLGLISGVGVLLCVLTAFTLLPALLVLFAPGEAELRPRRPWSLRLLAWPTRRPGLSALLAGGLVVAAAASAPGLRFDYDLLNLQPAGTQAAELARGEVAERVQTHQAFSLAADLDEARERAARFRALPSVASVRSAADLLPVDLASRRDGLLRLARRLAPALSTATGGTAPDPAAVAAASARLEEVLLDAQDLAFEAGRTELVKALSGAVAASEELRGRLGARSAGGLAGFRDATRSELAALAHRSAELAEGRGAEPADLPSPLAARLVTASGRLAVIVEPVEAVWDRPALERFVGELRTVDPEVTGPPVQVLEITEMMRRSYERAALLALLVIATIVILSLRSVLGALLTLAPLVAGFLLTLGTLRWLGIPLNPANLVALPLILGIGVDNGLHVAHRWLRLRHAATAVFEVGHAIVVTSLTTIAGFSGLLLAAHRGVRSLGAVAVVGTAAMLLCSVVLLPAVLTLLERRRPPGTAP